MAINIDVKIERSENVLMSGEKPKKINVHEGLAQMNAESPEEYADRLRRESEHGLKQVERIGELLKEGKSVREEFPHLRY